MIDTHVHIWYPPSIQYPHIAGWERKLPPADCKLLSTIWTANGVEKGMVVQPGCYGYRHSFLFSLLAKNTNFFGIGIIDPCAEGLEDRIKEFEAKRIVGLRLKLVELDQLNEPHLYLLACAQDRNMPVNLLINPHQMELVEEIVRKFPNLKVVLDHIGRIRGRSDPSLKQLLSLAEARNLFVKVSAIPYLSNQEYPFADVMEAVSLLLDTFGAPRMMWGSDFPWLLKGCSYEEAIRLFDRNLAFSREDLDWLFSQTAANVYGI